MSTGFGLGQSERKQSLPSVIVQGCITWQSISLSLCSYQTLELFLVTALLVPSIQGLLEFKIILTVSSESL